MVGITTPQLEITTLADIPAGTGLGSSGSFTTALLKALHAHRTQLAPRPANWPSRRATSRSTAWASRSASRTSTSPRTAASPASTFTATAGRGRAAARSATRRCTTWKTTCCCSSPASRARGRGILRTRTGSTGSDARWSTTCTSSRSSACAARTRSRAGDLRAFGELMHEHWEHKKQRSGGMSNPQIDEWYELARGNGAIGGKLVGAGGGGFLLFYARSAAAAPGDGRGGAEGSALPVRFRGHARHRDLARVARRASSLSSRTACAARCARCTGRPSRRPA